MYDRRNSVMHRAGFALDAQTSNPIALGDCGIWFDGTTEYFVKTDGTMSPMGTAPNSYHEACRMATAAALAAGTYSSTTLKFTETGNLALTVDGKTANVGDRILVKNQVDATQNGIYVVTAKGSGSAQFVLTRAPDCNASNMFEPGFIVPISEGTVNADTVYMFTADADFVMDTNDAIFAQAPLAITYGLVGAMAASGATTANAVGVANSVARIDHVHAVDTAVVATLTGSQALSNKTLTTPVLATGCTASGAGTFDLSGSTAAFKPPTGTFTFQGKQAATATANTIADPGGANGAIPVTTSGVCMITTAGAETGTLAIPTFVGQRLTLICDTYAVGDRVITSAQSLNQANNTIMTFGAAADMISLLGCKVGGALRWRVVANDGVALS